VATYPHNLECSLTVLGKQGPIKIGGIAMNACELWEVKNAPQPHIPEGLMPNQYAGGMYVGSCPNHYFVYENLVNTVIKGKESFLNGSDALESLRIIDGIKESSEKGIEVELKK
jgi:UDP-N-acetyl-2-amino-2-deoxyglucuronate dehydrogenase